MRGCTQAHAHGLRVEAARERPIRSVASPLTARVPATPAPTKGTWGRPLSPAGIALKLKAPSAPSTSA